MALEEFQKTRDTLLDRQLQKTDNRIRKNYLWIFAHIDELRKDFPDKYIAVDDEQVRFSADKIDALITEITSANRNVEDYVIEFVGKKPLNLLL